MAKIRKIYDETIKPNGEKTVIYPITSTRAVYTPNSVTIDSLLNEGYRFGGVALPTDSPSITDQRVFYGASVPGTYTNFGGINVDGGEAIFLMWDGAEWHKGIFGGAGSSNLTGFKSLTYISELPLEPTMIGYLIGDYMYVWVGENGDTLQGKYQNVGQLRGASAYEVAVRNGYEGTEQQWLNDPIHGIKGVSVASVAEVGTHSTENSAENTYRITLTNNETLDMKVKNGKGINSVAVVGGYSTVDGAENTYRITLSDNTTFEFKVRNGSQGSTGSSVAYPFELLNVLNSTATDKGVSALKIKELNEGTAHIGTAIDQNNTTIKHINDYSGTNFYPVAHEKGVIDDAGTSASDKFRRTLPEWHLTGKGNDYTSIPGTPAIAGHKYRFTIKSWPNDEVTQTGSSYVQFGIYKNETGTSNGIILVQGTNTIEPVYEIVAPEGCTSLLIGGRVNSGAEGVVIVEDITDIDEAREGISTLNNNAIQRELHRIEPYEIVDTSAIDNQHSLISSSYWQLWKYNVTPGERFWFSGRRTMRNSYYYINWYDADGNWVDRSWYWSVDGGNTRMRRREATVPNNATRAFVNVEKAYASSYAFFEEAGEIRAQTIENYISELRNAVGNIGTTDGYPEITYADGYISKSNGNVVSSENYRHAIVSVGTAQRVKFSGAALIQASNYLSGYAFYNSENECISYNAWDYGNNTIKEYIVDIPEGAVTFKTTIASPSNNTNSFPHEAEFYCYLLSGSNVADKIVELDELKKTATAYEYPLMEYEMLNQAVYTDGSLTSNSSYYKIFKYPVVAGNTYYFSGRTRARLTYYTINWFDSEGNYLSHQYPGSMSQAYTYDKKEIVAPANAAYLYMNVDKKLAATYALYENGDIITAQDMYGMISSMEKGTNGVRLLCIGNSYSQDALAYVPFIVDAMGNPFDITIGILMLSSSTVQNHINNFENNLAKYTFYYHPGGNTAWENLGTKTIQWALENYEWDIIFTHSVGGGADEVKVGSVNRLINDIHSVLGYPVKFGWMLHQARPSKVNSGPNKTEEEMRAYLESAITIAKLLYDQTSIDMVIPIGTAIQNARSIASLEAMGGYADNEQNTSGKGYMCPYDGVHLQEGLPCQIASYTVILSLLDHLGLSTKGIFGESSRIDSDWTSGKNIPGPHGTPIGSDDENCRIGQLCAIMANEFPYEVADMNPIVYDDVSGLPYEAHADTSGKADKDLTAVAGNVAKFNEKGNPVDAGFAADTVLHGKLADVNWEETPGRRVYVNSDSVPSSDLLKGLLLDEKLFDVKRITSLEGIVRTARGFGDGGKFTDLGRYHIRLFVRPGDIIRMKQPEDKSWGRCGFFSDVRFYNSTNDSIPWVSGTTLQQIEPGSEVLLRVPEGTAAFAVEIGEVVEESYSRMFEFIEIYSRKDYKQPEGEITPFDAHGYIKYAGTSHPTVEGITYVDAWVYPMYPGYKYLMKLLPASDSNTTDYYAILPQLPTSGVTPILSGSRSGVHHAVRETEVSAPSFMLVTAPSARIASFTATKLDSVSDSQEDVKKLIDTTKFETPSLTRRNNYIYTLRGEWTESTTYKHYLIPINGAKWVKLTAKATNNTIYAFLTADGNDENGYAQYVDGEVNNRTVPMGTTEVISIPEDANFLYIYYGSTEYVGPDYIGLSKGTVDATESEYSFKAQTNDLQAKLAANAAAIGLYPLERTLDNDGWEVPRTLQQKIVVQKCNQWANLRWTAKSTIPGKNSDYTGGTTFTHGIPYSSNMQDFKHVGIEVSIHTFMTAANNPYSLLYTENINGDRATSIWGRSYDNSNGFAYYGTVCCGLTSGAVGAYTKYSNTTHDNHAKYLGIWRPVERKAKVNWALLEIGDVFDDDSHSCVIVGIQRDSSGNIIKVKEAESVAGSEAVGACYVREKTPEQLESLIGSTYKMYHYKYTPLYNNITIEDASAYVSTAGVPVNNPTYNNDICTIYGDKACLALGDLMVINYNLNDNPTYIWTGAEVYKDDVLLETFTLASIDQTELPEGQRNHAIKLGTTLAAGKYKARMTDGTHYSEYTYWEILPQNISVEKLSDGVYKVSNSATKAEMVYVYLGSPNSNEERTFYRARCGRPLEFYETDNREFILYAEGLAKEFGVESYLPMVMRIVQKGDYGLAVTATIQLEESNRGTE